MLRRVSVILSSGIAVAFVAGMLLALAGGMSVWLRFPMSAPVPGTAVLMVVPGLSGLDLPIATLFLALVLLLLVASLANWRPLVGVAWLAAWMVLFYFPWQILFHDPQWLLEYMRDSVLRGDLQRFINSHFLKNKGVEPTLTYITDFEHLADRTLLIWHLLGWGWMLSLLGLIIFAIGQSLRRGFPVTGRSALLVGLSSPGLLLIVVGFPALVADWQHYRADRLLATDEPRKALQAYARAINLDPMLGYSAPFLTKVSKAYYLIVGEAEPSAQLYLVNEDLKRKPLDLAEARLANIDVHTLPPSPFSASMASLIRKKRAEAYISRGVIADKRGDLSISIRYYKLALEIDPTLINAQFFLAKALLDVRDLNGALQIALSLPEQVYHSSVKADFYSLIGDCYRLMGETNKAREAYFTSYELDNKDNYRSMKELSGT